MENVPIDPQTRRFDLNDDSLTENTRGAYPLDYIDNYLPSKMAGHPRNVILLTCDASGVMPPIARLLKRGATCWLVNTGWTGGSFGIGKRISIRHTRALLNAALSGKLHGVE